MFRGDLQHTGAYDGRGVPELHGVRWKFRTNGQVYSSPAVVDGLAIVGSTDGNLYAIDAGSGTAKWKFQTKARITSSPAVDAGVAYFESYDSNFYAVDVATGALKWKFATNGEKRFSAPHMHGMLPASEPVPDPFDFYLSSPAVANGAVYFGSGDGNIYALDASTGSLKWKFQTADVVHASPAVSDGLVFVGSWDTYFYALDANTGSEKWKFKTGEDPGISQPDRHSVVGRRREWHRVLRLPRLEALRARRAHGRKSVDRRQQRVVGDRFSRRPRRQGVLHDLRQRPVPRRRCAVRRRAVLVVVQVADVLVPRRRRQSRIHRLARRQAAGDRRHGAEGGVDLPDRRVASERPGAHDARRASRTMRRRCRRCSSTRSYQGYSG